MCKITSDVRGRPNILEVRFRPNILEVRLTSKMFGLNRGKVHTYIPIYSTNHPAPSKSRSLWLDGPLGLCDRVGSGSDRKGKKGRPITLGGQPAAASMSHIARGEPYLPTDSPTTTRPVSPLKEH